jgi:hypothetical protein
VSQASTADALKLACLKGDRLRTYARTSESGNGGRSGAVRSACPGRSRDLRCGCDECERARRKRNRRSERSERAIRTLRARDSARAVTESVPSAGWREVAEALDALEGMQHE